MISDKNGLELHDKASKGEALTEQEKAQLELWYSQLDSGEVFSKKAEEQSPDLLKGQIETALVQLLKTTQRLQKIAAENEVIKRENQAIKLKLAKSLGQKAA